MSARSKRRVSPERSKRGDYGIPHVLSYSISIKYGNIGSGTICTYISIKANMKTGIVNKIRVPQSKLLDDFEIKPSKDASGKKRVLKNDKKDKFLMYGYDTIGYTRIIRKYLPHKIENEKHVDEKMWYEKLDTPLTEVSEAASIRIAHIEETVIFVFTDDGTLVFVTTDGKKYSISNPEELVHGETGDFEADDYLLLQLRKYKKQNERYLNNVILELTGFSTEKCTKTNAEHPRPTRSRTSSPKA